jgi:hypothetical protein
LLDSLFRERRYLEAGCRGIVDHLRLYAHTAVVELESRKGLFRKGTKAVLGVVEADLVGLVQIPNIQLMKQGTPYPKVEIRLIFLCMH